MTSNNQNQNMQSSTSVVSHARDVLGDRKYRQLEQVIKTNMLDEEIKKAQDNAASTGEDIKVPRWVQRLKDSMEKESLFYMFEQSPQLHMIFNNGLVSDDMGQETGKGTGNGGGNGSGKGSGTVGMEEIPLQSILPLDGKNFLIYGKCQSGKTAFIMGVAMSHVLFSKCTAVVVLRNSIGDAKQLQERVEEFVTSHKAWMAEKQDRYDVGKSLTYVYAGLKSARNLQKIHDTLSGKIPGMVITIANNTQMQTIKDTIDTIDNPRYITCIDEADQVAYGNQSVDFRQTLNDSVLETSGRTYTVSATTFDTIFTEKKIKTSSIIVMKPKGYYKGLRQIEKHALRTDALPATGSNMWFGNDGNVLPVLKYLNNKSCNADDYNPRKNYQQPVITLIKATHLNKAQIDLMDKITSNPELDQWAVLVYNGKGIYISTPHIDLLNKMGGRRKSSGLQVPETMNIPNCRLFKGQVVNAGLQYFYDLNKILKKQRKKPISHIAIIAGDLADRGISFVSTNYKWHPTHMYYVPTEKSTVSHVIQAAGRLCGNFDDNIPLRLYAPESVLDDLVKGTRIQDEMLERANQMELEQSVRSVMKNMKFAKCKVPEKKFGHQEEATIKKKNIVLVGSDGGQSRSGYKKALAKIEEGDYEIDDVSDSKEEEVIPHPDQKEFNRLTTRMFPKWSKDDTRISRFMYDIVPCKIYHKAEFIKMCSQSNKSYKNLMKYDNPRIDYGMVFEEVEGGIQMYQSLVQPFIKNFNYVV